MATRKRAKKILRVGVLGVRRGQNFAGKVLEEAVGAKVVAICDKWEEYVVRLAQDLNRSRKKSNRVTAYTDYDKFLGHDLDAVVLANYFHEHAPFAVKALQAGKHVLSETSACGTIGEGVALVEAVEKSGKTYMFGENYAYTVDSQEMRRLYREGLIGEFEYGEGEYVHSRENMWIGAWRSPGHNHWRNWIPATYYCTHSMAPIMYVTETRPVKVNGFVVPRDVEHALDVRRNDRAGLIMCRMNNNALVKLLRGTLVGGGNRYRIHGRKGLMERCRLSGMLDIRLDPHDKDPSEPTQRLYQPGFPSRGDIAAGTGHGGSDFFVYYDFVKAVRTGKPPILDVYRAVDMSIIGILAFKSVLNDSAPFEVPDFHDPAMRDKYRNDDWSPDPAKAKPGQPPSSILGDVKPSRKNIRHAERIWKEKERHLQGKSWKKIGIDGKVIAEYTADESKANRIL